MKTVILGILAGLLIVIFYWVGWKDGIKAGRQMKKIPQDKYVKVDLNDFCYEIDEDNITITNEIQLEEFKRYRRID